MNTKKVRLTNALGLETGRLANVIFFLPGKQQHRMLFLRKGYQNYPQRDVNVLCK